MRYFFILFVLLGVIVWFSKEKEYKGWKGVKFREATFYDGKGVGRAKWCWRDTNRNVFIVWMGTVEMGGQKFTATDATYEAKKYRLYVSDFWEFTTDEVFWARRGLYKTKIKKFDGEGGVLYRNSTVEVHASKIHVEEEYGRYEFYDSVEVVRLKTKGSIGVRKNDAK